MSKAIMISIKPKWCAEILNGNKTIEIRKTIPKCELPIDVYIYCTKDKEHLYRHFDNKFMVFNEFNKLCSHNGKVVAKFTLNKVEEITFNDKDVQKKSCLTEDELFDYLFVNEPYQEDMKTGYAWFISNLIIFDKPKELSEFRKMYRSKGYPQNQSWYLTKAPQSWCYVEVVL